MSARRAAWVAAGWLGAANLVGYALRHALAPALPELRARLAVDEAQFGLLATVFMATHAAATLVFGWLGDRLDRRRVIAAGLALAAVATVASAAAPSFVALALARAACGVGTAAIVPVANSLLSELFDGPVKATALGVFNLGLFLGGVVGFGLGDALGFPGVLWALAAPTAALALVVAVLRVAPRRVGAPVASLADVAREGRVLLGRTSFRWLLASTTAMAFASGAYLTWFVEFLRAEKGMSEAAAGSLFATCIVGGLAGVLVGGRVADRFARQRPAGRLWAIALGMASTVPCAAACIVLPVGPALYVLAIATMFFVSWYHAPMAASIDDLASPGGAASAQAGVIFLMHLAGTAPASWVVGVLIGPLGFVGAMLVPTALVGVAAALMALATRGFAADRARARAGGAPAAVLSPPP